MNKSIESRLNVIEDDLVDFDMKMEDLKMEIRDLAFKYNVLDFNGGE